MPDATPKILVGYEGSEQANDALALAEVLAGLTGARLLLACIYPDEPIKADEDQYEMRADAAANLTVARTRVEADRKTAPGSSPARGLHNLAEHESVQAIVLGSTHRGPLGRIALGSVAERLLHGAPCAVAVAPGGYHSRAAREPRRITVAYDASPESRAAVHAAAALADGSEIELELVTVVEPIPDGFRYVPTAVDYARLKTLAQAQAQRDLDTAVGESPAGTTRLGQLLHGDPADALISACERTDLLVMGSRGYGPVRSVLLGGVSRRVMREAPCPVLVVPRGAKAPGVDAAEENAAIEAS